MVADLEKPVIITCADMAARLGATVAGDGSVELTHVAPLQSANAGALSFVSHSRFLPDLRTCKASAVLLKSEWAEQSPCVGLISDNPYLAYARATAVFNPRDEDGGGVHPSSVVSPTASLGNDVRIGAGASVDDNAHIGDRVSIGAGCRIGKNVSIGNDTRLRPNVVVETDCLIGEGCLIQAGAVVGSDGFGYAQDGDRWVHIPQIGRVVIGNRVEVGANTTIDRGALDDTIVEDGVILDNQIQVAHNVIIGENTAIAGCVGIAGSAKIGKRCTIGGATTILGHLEIVDDVHINAMSLVTSSIKSPGSYASSTPLDETSVWRKNFARFRKLDEMARRLKLLERSKAPGKDNSD